MKNIYILLCLWLICSLNANTLFLNNPKKDWAVFFSTILSKHPINTFVESGTYLGHTAQKAAPLFAQVQTVELYEKFYHKATKYLKPYPNVIVHYGNTVDIFPSILSQLTMQHYNALFWLDGHFMTCMSSEDKVENFLPSDFTPVTQELQIIKNSGIKQSIILIDDIRLFGTLLNNKRIERAGNIHYPLLATTRDYLHQMGYDSVIWGDILFAYDQNIPLVFSSLIHACTISRIFDGNNYDINKLLEAEQIIAHAHGQEYQALQELYHDFSKPWRGWHNKSPHYNLWYALILQKENLHQQACEHFQEVLDLGYDHWRIYWYLAQSSIALHNLYEASHYLQKVVTIQPDFEPAHTLLNTITS